MKLISILSLQGEKQSGGLCSDHTAGVGGSRTLIKKTLSFQGHCPTLSYAYQAHHLWREVDHQRGLEVGRMAGLF